MHIPSKVGMVLANIIKMLIDNLIKKIMPAKDKKTEKTLGNTTASGARKNVKDIRFWGDGDTFKLVSKASSKAEGWMKSTKAMEIPKLGCVVQVTTQQRNKDGSYSVAEAVCFVPGARLNVVTGENGKTVSRNLIK